MGSTSAVLEYRVVAAKLSTSRHSRNTAQPAGFPLTESGRRAAVALLRGWRVYCPFALLRRKTSLKPPAESAPPKTTITFVAGEYTAVCVFLGVGK